MALQRWNKSTTPVVGVDSVVTYTFPAIGQGFAAMVSVSVPGSDAVNQWDVLVSGSLITSVSGSQVVGPVWLANGDVITIVGTPLFGAGPAVAVGVVGLPNEIPPTSMAPSPGGQLTTISPVVETYAGPSATVQVPVGATGILILSSVPVLSVIGVNGATNYPVSLYSPGQPLGEILLYFAPVNGLWENSSRPGGVVVTVASAGGGGVIEVFPVQGDLGWPEPRGYNSAPLTYGTGGFLLDSGPNGQTLTETAGVTQVAGPPGGAFGDAAQIGAGDSMSGPVGATNAQGAVTGTAFTVELIVTPVAVTGNTQIIGRVSGTNEWFITIDAGNVAYAMWNAAGVASSFTGSHAVAAGTTYRVSMTWDGTTVRGFLNGVLDGSAAMASAQAPSAAQGLLIGNDAATYDEVRISNIARYTSGYTPATAEFASDANTGCLYHFDTSSAPTLSVGLAGWEEVVIIEAPGSSTPTVRDANGIAYPVTVVAAGGLWWAPIPSANGTPLTVSTSTPGTAVLKSKNPYLG